MNDTIAIKVNELSKKYSIGGAKNDSLRGSLSKIKFISKAGGEEFRALNNVSFEIKKGDVVGIIGKNGAGKSTLLKILSQITKPTDGRIEINGRIASLLEVGTGFHPDLTGRENIYLNGTILGMTRKEVKDKFDAIVSFSGVGKFIDTPVKHYSSGMYVRLAFAVAAHLEPEILIIDEVLAVGDAEFQKKCLGKMQDVANNGRTVLFVSHNLAALNAICDKGIVLKNGEIVYSGIISEAITKYTSDNTSVFNKRINVLDFERERGMKKLLFSEIIFDKEIYYPNSSLKISLRTKLIDTLYNPEYVNFGLHIVDQFENQVYHLSNLFLNLEKAPYHSDSIYSFEIENLNLKSGIYTLWFWMESNNEEQDFIKSGIHLEIQNGNRYNYINSSIISGVVQPDFNFFIQ